MQFQKALDIDPEFAKAHLKLAFAFADGRQYDEAMVHFRKAAELKPDNAESHYCLGAILAGRGQVDAATAEYRKALQIKPDYAARNRPAGCAASDAAIGVVTNPIERQGGTS